MKITNKKIIAALLIAATLTGCDSLNNKAKDNEEDTKVESTVDENEAEKAGEEEADVDESTEDAEGEEGKEDAKDGEDAEGEEDATSEAETDSGQTVEERLEDAIFNNRVQARAAEILLEETPESLSEEFKAKLEDLLAKSNDIIERSEKALEAYK